MTRTFTGRHMLAIIVGFFAVVVAVNLVMARFAITTFGGTVVDNSYVASQKFNRWLDEANAQKQQGWHADATRREGHVLVSLWDMMGAMDGAQISAVAMHPVGRSADVSLHFRQIGRGYYQSLETIPAGRWQLKVQVANGNRVAHFKIELPV